MRRLEGALGLPLLKVAWIFFKIGLVFFGGGYVLIPLIHRELVVNMGLLTEREFLDGAAISQLTPGPIAVMATFAGYKMSGIAGALVGTVAVFAPGTILMLFLSASYSHLSRYEPARKVLNSLIPAIAGLLIASAWMLGRESVSNIPAILILLVSLTAIIRYKINPAILIGAAAAIGLIFRL